MIYHIAYFSTATKLFTETDLTELLANSKQNNSALSVTGILLFIEGCFLQVLEGDESVVKSIFEKVKQDERHHDVLTLFQGNKPERAFENWSMGFKNLPLVEYKRQIGFEDITNEEFLTNILKKKHPKISRTLEIFYTGGI